MKRQQHGRLNRDSIVRTEMLTELKSVSFECLSGPNTRVEMNESSNFCIFTQLHGKLKQLFEDVSRSREGFIAFHTKNN